MKRLDKESEQRMLAAVDTAAELADAGLSPNDAVVKAAMQHNLPVGHLGPVVHAYNIAMTTRQLDSGESAVEKAAEFPLADLDTIKAAAYPQAVKAAVAALRPDKVADVYTLPPSRSVVARNGAEKRASQDFMQQFLAANPPEAAVGVPPRQVSTEQRLKVASLAASRAQTAAVDAHRDGLLAWEAFVDTLEKLGSYFRRPGCVPVSQVRANCRVMHDEAGAAVIDAVADETPGLAAKLDKTAAARGLAVGEPYDLVAKALAIAATFPQKRAAREAAIAKATELGREADMLAFGSEKDWLTGQHEPLRSTPIKAAGWADPFKTIGSMLGTVGGAKGTGAAGARKRMENKPPAAAPPTFSPYSSLPKGFDLANEESFDRGVAAISSEMDDPEHLNELRQVRSLGALYDVMGRDPVIRGYDPQEVSRAYNDITEAAPALSDQRLALQGLLRKRLTQGFLDPFEVSQTYQMGRDVNDQHRTTKAE